MTICRFKKYAFQTLRVKAPKSAIYCKPPAVYCTFGKAGTSCYRFPGR